MIIALEGPDCCGKSTVFGKLMLLYPAARYVPGMPNAPELANVMHAVEERQLALWEYLYSPRELYICDRHVVVSSMVYDRLYGRELLDVSMWYNHVRVVYFDVLTEELQARHASRGDTFDPARYEEVKQLYMDVLQNFKHAVVNASQEIPYVVQQVLKCIRSWQ